LKRDSHAESVRLDKYAINICLILSTIYIFIPVSGCVGIYIYIGATMCLGAYDAVKTALGGHESEASF